MRRGRVLNHAEFKQADGEAEVRRKAVPKEKFLPMPLRPTVLPP